MNTFQKDNKGLRAATLIVVDLCSEQLADAQMKFDEEGWIFTFDELDQDNKNIIVEAYFDENPNAIFNDAEEVEEYLEREINWLLPEYDK